MGTARTKMNRPFYADGLCFSCVRCSRCCSHEPGYVYLSKKDLEKLLHWSGLDTHSFIEKYCRWVPYYSCDEKVLSLKEKPDFSCILEDRGCSAYQERPIQCVTYPFWNFILKDKSNWKIESRSCPGIDRGKLHLQEEIEEAMLRHRNNSPLKITECRF